LHHVSRLICGTLLLGAAMLAGCTSTEENAAAGLALAPAEQATVLPEPAAAPPSSPEPEETIALRGPIDARSAPGKQGRLVRQNFDDRFDGDMQQVASLGEPVVGLAEESDALGEADAFSLTPDTAPIPPEFVALNAEPPKSLAQKALEVTGLARFDQPAGNVDRLIEKYAALYEVPVELVRRVVKRESNFQPSAYNRGHWGLMQIKHATARGMGYRGSAKGLLDPETNLKYAVKYLRGALMVADGNHDRADRLYQTGYYYDAKRKGLLDETGLGRDRRRRG